VFHKNRLKKNKNRKAILGYSTYSMYLICHGSGENIYRIL